MIDISYVRPKSSMIIGRTVFFLLKTPSIQKNIVPLQKIMITQNFRSNGNIIRRRF